MCSQVLDFCLFIKFCGASCCLCCLRLSLLYCAMQLGMKINWWITEFMLMVISSLRIWLAVEECLIGLLGAARFAPPHLAASLLLLALVWISTVVAARPADYRFVLLRQQVVFASPRSTLLVAVASGHRPASPAYYCSVQINHLFLLFSGSCREMEGGTRRSHDPASLRQMEGGARRSSTSADASRTQRPPAAVASGRRRVLEWFLKVLRQASSYTKTSNLSSSS